MTEQIQKRLRAKQTPERISAVRQAAALDSPDRQALLLTALADKSHYVAALAAEALGQHADDTAAAAMTDRLTYLSEDGPAQDPGCHIRSNLAFALGRLHYSPAATALKIGLRTTQIEAVGGVPFDTAAHLRGNCALALAQLREGDSIRDIALLLFDRSGNLPGHLEPKVKMEPRKAAARALSLTGSASARLPLTLRLVHPENEEPEVLQECMQALVDLEDPHAPEVLALYLKHRDLNLAAFAALSLARTQSPEAAALIGDALPRFTGDPLKAVVLALTTLRTPEATELLYGLVRSNREAVRLAAVDALPPNSATWTVLQALAAHDPSPHVRQAAQAALDTSSVILSSFSG